MTGTPLPPAIRKIGVLWTLKKGYAVDEDGNKLSREGSSDGNISGFPIIENSDDEGSEETSYFHTEYEWKSVRLDYDVLSGSGKKPLIGFTISAQLFEYEESQERPGEVNDIDTPPEPIKVVNTRLIDYDLRKITIKSNDPNDGDTWVFPNDYPEVIVDPNHPIQYGGVVLFDDVTATFKKAGEKSTCGIDDGPQNDGTVEWFNQIGGLEFVTSGYNYIDVFDNADYSYVPMNSNESVKIQNNDTFRFTPLYPDVVDPEAKAAPIYPMNIITAFLPDNRDSVTITYDVSIEASNPVTGELFIIENPNVTVKQTCTQDTGNFTEQLDALLSYCNWHNPGDIDDEDFSPRYPFDYPYTLVNGHQGLGLFDVPTTRGDDKDNDPLERGDVWYNPAEGTRQYYNISDIPDELSVHKEGDAYTDMDEVPCVWMVPRDDDGKPLRCSKVEQMEEVPHGLLCDIRTKNGKIVSAKMSATAQPSGFKDGDYVSVSAGNGDAVLEVSITSQPGWIDNYVRIY